MILDSIHAVEDAARHRREVIRHIRRADRLAAGAAAARAQAEIHALLASIAEAGEPIPDFVAAELPTMLAWEAGE